MLKDKTVKKINLKYFQGKHLLFIIYYPLNINVKNFNFKII
jgi:hypothetical protein